MGREVEWDESLLKRREQRGKTSPMLKAAIRPATHTMTAFTCWNSAQNLSPTPGVSKTCRWLDNRDGTRSLLNRGDKKLMVTFGAENQDYDKSSQSTTSTTGGRGQKSLLPLSSHRTAKTSRMKQLLSTSKSDNTSDPSLTKCVDVHLCVNCDNDFNSLPERITHE